MTPAEVTAVLALFSATFPSLRVTQEILAAWSLALEDADAHAVRDSALRFIRGQVRERNNAFAPSVAELLADVEAQRAVQDLAAEASRKRLEASATARELATEDQLRAAMREAGYTDQGAWHADRIAGTVVSPDDARHRWFDFSTRRVRDDREHPRPASRVPRGGPASSLGDALRTPGEVP